MLGMRAHSSQTLLIDDPNFLYICGNGHETVRHLRLWRTTTEGHLAVVTERDDDEGMSVTNAAEQVWAAVQRKYGDPERVIPVIEHYPGQPGESDTFDAVTLGLHGHAQWERVTPALLLLSIGLDAYPDG